MVLPGTKKMLRWRQEDVEAWLDANVQGGGTSLMSRKAEKSKRFRPHDYADHLRTSRLWRQDGGVLHYWTGNFWKAVTDVQAEKAAYEWIVRHDPDNASSENARKAFKAALLWCESLPSEIPDVVIPCANGYLHVQHGVIGLESADADLGLRHELSCSYDPDAPTPTKFRAFLESVLPDEAVRRRVQEYFGYTLTSDARYQVAQYWLGSGANGKGVLAKILMALHSRPESVQLDGLDGFKLASLIDATLIYCDEAPRKPMNEQIVKSLIAGERVQIDRKYRDPISVNLRAKWLVLGNHIPAVTDHSGGFWRRWNFVPLTSSFQNGSATPCSPKPSLSTS